MTSYSGPSGITTKKHPWSRPETVLHAAVLAQAESPPIVLMSGSFRALRGVSSEEVVVISRWPEVRFVPLVAFLVIAALAVVPSFSSAKSIKKKVGATVVFKQATNPENATNCGVTPLLQWKDPSEKGFIGSSWEGHYFFLGKEEVVHPVPPFHNRFTWLGVSFATSSSNWWSLGDGTWRAGGDPGEAAEACAGYLKKYQQMFGPKAWVIVTGEVKRVIKGTVKVSCSASGSCPKVNAIAGVTVRAGSASTTTAEDGKYVLGVNKGKYTVTAVSKSFNIKTKPQKVDLTRKKEAKADFKACGLKGGASAARATASALGKVTLHGKTTSGGNCTNQVKVTYAPPNTVKYSWMAALMCGGGAYYKDAATGQSVVGFIKDKRVVPSATPPTVGGRPVSRLTIGTGSVDFLDATYNTSGTIKAKSGTFSGRVGSDKKPFVNTGANVDCSYQVTDLALAP